MTAENLTELMTASLSSESIDLLRAIGALAEERGTRAFVVGGLVRDLFLRTGSEDLDIVLEESAMDFAGAAVESLGGAAKAHTRFGTVILVLPNGRKIDLATARRESYERPGALPTVASGDMAQDLLRRDYTMNAMAIHLNPVRFGELIDVCGGRSDIRHGVLRALTSRSFEDDPTRILRGVRFSARFGMEFEGETRRLLLRAVRERRTDTVSGERLMNELMLILGEGDPAEPVRMLIEWGILHSMVPEWDPPEDTPDALCRALRLMDEAGQDDLRSSADRKLTLMLALLQPAPEEVRERAAERLSAGRRLRELLRELRALGEGALEELAASGDLPRSAIYRRLRTFSAETIVVSLAVSRSEALSRRLRLYAGDLWDAATELDGATLTRLGLPEGRAVGELLDAVLDARLDGEVSTLDEEISLARSMAPSLTPPERPDNVSGAEKP